MSHAFFSDFLELITSVVACSSTVFDFAAKPASTASNNAFNASKILNILSAPNEFDCIANVRNKLFYVRNDFAKLTHFRFVADEFLNKI